MRLYAHNLLACLKCQSFPLEIGPNSVIGPTGDEYDEDFVRRMLPRLDYASFYKAYTTLQQQHEALLGQRPIPPTLQQIDPANTEHLQAVWYAMSAIAVRTATLHCGHCQSVYEVRDYIPVMLPMADAGRK